jgi:poly(3-hydroxybutyrate) depolymerase
MITANGCRASSLIMMAIVIHLAVAQAAVAQRVSKTATFMERGGPVQRFWIEYRPPGVPATQPLPTVYVLHPGASNPDNVANNSRWDAVAQANTLMIVYPQASPGSTLLTGVWNAWDWDGAPIPNGTPTGLSNRDDVGFLAQLVELINTRQTERSDPLRVYMTGFSSGTQMVLTYAGAGLKNVAAYAPVSGGWCEPFGVASSFCRPAGPTPVWMWRGGRENNLTPGGVSRLIHDELQRDFWLAFNASGTVPDSTESIPVTAIRSAQGVDEQVVVTHETKFYRVGATEVRYTEVLEGSHEYQVGAAPRIWTEFFSRFALRTADCNNADFDCDAGVNIEDLYRAYASPADLNGDGRANADDALGLERFVRRNEAAGMSAGRR